MTQALRELKAMVRLMFVLTVAVGCVTLVGLTAYGFVAFFIRQAVR